jgi:regulatory protein
MPLSKAKTFSFSEIYLKASSFCAYQERTQNEVRHKLYELGVNKDVIEEIISDLIVENFINEERFAKAFAGGKFRIKKWGKNKIRQALKEKGLSLYCIKKGLQEIENEDYEKTLRSLVEKRMLEEKEKNIFKKKDKISKFLIRKGYEPEFVWEMLNSYLNK